jgi:hypothetical protein
VVQSFEQLSVIERRHGPIPAEAGTERIRLAVYDAALAA